MGLILVDRKLLLRIFRRISCLYSKKIDLELKFFKMKIRIRRIVIVEKLIRIQNMFLETQTRKETNAFFTEHCSIIISN